VAGGLCLGWSVHDWRACLSERKVYLCPAIIGEFDAVVGYELVDLAVLVAFALGVADYYEELGGISTYHSCYGGCSAYSWFTHSDG